MAAGLAEVPGQVGVTGIEADPQASQVRPLGQRVHSQHPFDTVLQNRPGRAAPGELHIALIGQHRNASLSPPPGGLP